MESTVADKKVWMITGASSGMGLGTCLSALRKGHKVLATTRSPDKARLKHLEVESNGGIWVELDMAQGDTTARVGAAIQEHGGRIDVLVNNAGYNQVGMIEDLSDEDMLLSLQTHIMGPHRVLKAVLPYMRAQMSGAIILNGSIFGYRAVPSNGAYCIQKAAVDMLHETLRIETKSFNIRVIIVNSGVFRTDLVTSARQINIPEYYLAPGTAMGELLPYLSQIQADPASIMRGDPNKWGERVVELVDKTGYGSALSNASRLLLGPDSIVLANQMLRRLQKEISDSSDIAMSTDIDGTSGVGVSFLNELAL